MSTEDARCRSVEPASAAEGERSYPAATIRLPPSATLLLERLLEVASARQAGEGIEVGQRLQRAVGPLEVLALARHLALEADQLELALHPRQHLGRLEGLEHAVGAAGFEGPLLVRPILERAHEDDREVAGRLVEAEAAADLETAEAGKTAVWHHH